MASDAYSTFDIKNKLGIKIDRLKDWMNRRYIEPSIQKASGQGTKNLFSRFDLYLIKLFEHLINRGISRNDAAVRISFLKTVWLYRKSDNEAKKSIFNKFSEYRKIKDILIPALVQDAEKLMSAEFLVLPMIPVEDNNVANLIFYLEPMNKFVEKEDSVGIRGFFIREDDCRNFEDLLIVNFKKIRDQVDKAVS